MTWGTGTGRHLNTFGDVRCLRKSRSTQRAEKSPQPYVGEMYNFEQQLNDVDTFFTSRDDTELYGGAYSRM